MARTYGHKYPTAIPAQDVYEESETQKGALGDRLQLGERVFRYAQCGSSGVNAGELLQGPAPDGNNTGLAVNEPSAGQDEIEVTTGSSAFTEDEFRDGWLWLDNVAGTPAYKVKHNDAADSGGSAATFELYDPLTEDVATANTAALYVNQYRGLIIHPSLPTAVLAGVPLLDVTASYYCWVQTWGPAAVLTEVASATNAYIAQADDGTDGAVTDNDAHAEPTVGVFMRAEGDGEHSLVYLRLAP